MHVSRIRSSLWGAFWPILPGVIAYALVYAWVSFRGEFGWEIVDINYQSLGTQALVAEPFKSLLSLHIQPPGLNALYAVVLAFPGNPATSLQAVFFLAGFFTVAFVVLSLLLIGVHKSFALTAGLLMGVVPTTVLYAMWPYGTTLVALFISASLVGIALLSKRPVLGSSIFVLSVVAVFYTRPSLIWVVAVLIVFFPVLVSAGRSRKQLLLVSALGATLILGLQAYHVSAFGSWTTTSWSGQNILKGLLWSGQVTIEDVRNVAGDDPCFRSLTQDLEFWGSVDGIDSSCFTPNQVPFSDALAVQDGYKDEGESIQLNSLRHLQLAPAMRSLALEVMIAHPLAFPQMILGVGPGQTSLELALLPGYQFAPLNENLVVGTPVLSFTRPLGLFLPIGGLTIMFFVGGAVLMARGRRWSEFATFTAASFFTSYGLLTSVIPEFGENNRFFVEVYPALIVGSVIALAVMNKSLRRGTK